MQPPPPPAPNKKSADLQAAVNHIRGHWLVYGIGVFIGLLSFLFTATDTLARAGDVIGGMRNPHAETYATLETLDLDSRLEYFEDNFGTAKSEFDLCEDLACLDAAPDSLRMYIHETDDLIVRAVFADEQLELYLVTLNSPELQPPMRGLGHDLGHLGEVTLADALAVAEVEPTSSQVFMGPYSSAYAEVVSAGAVADQRGLVLAWAYDGWGGPDLQFDAEAALDLQGAQDDGDEAAAAPALAAFRAGTTPNTWGEFRDDGEYVSTVVRDAGGVLAMLHVGTER